MDNESVIITSDDGDIILGQLQTRYFPRLLVEPNYVQILMGMVHDFLNLIYRDAVETLPNFVSYKEEKRHVLKMLQYDYAAVLGDNGRIAGAKHL